MNDLANFTPVFACWGILILFARSWGEVEPYGMKSIRFPPETMSETIGLGFRDDVTAE